MYNLIVMIKSTFIFLLKFIFGIVGSFVIILVIAATSELIKKEVEKRSWLKINTETVNGEVCVKKGGSYKSQYNIDCCPGLKIIDEESERDMDYTYDSNKPCLISLYGGTWVCTTCGNGICEGKENDCNCREDCLIPEDNGGYAPLKK